MDPFITHRGLVVPLDRANIDTDAIIPKQYLKSIKRTGFGVNLFDDWRYLDEGMLGDDHSLRRVNPDFVLNQPHFEGASILLTRDNFGCGSSREHAVWALADYGFRAVIAPSFADIFFNNSFKNGFLPIALAEVEVDQLFNTTASENTHLTIDLPSQTVSTDDGKSFGFEVDTFRKYRLIDGLDDIGLTLQNSDEIARFEKERAQNRPWLYQK